VDGEGSCGERRHGGEQRGEASDVVEVAVGDEEVAHALEVNTSRFELLEQDGAARGIKEYDLVPERDTARLACASSSFKGSPVPKRITRPTPHSFQLLLCSAFHP
jgi:hypothetical protein